MGENGRLAVPTDKAHVVKQCRDIANHGNRVAKSRAIACNKQRTVNFYALFLTQTVNSTSSAKAQNRTQIYCKGGICMQDYRCFSLDDYITKVVCEYTCNTLEVCPLITKSALIESAFTYFDIVKCWHISQYADDLSIGDDNEYQRFFHGHSSEFRAYISDCIDSLNIFMEV